MINDAVSLAQARKQLERMEDVVSALLSDSSNLDSSQLALQLEGPMKAIEQLRGKIEEYCGVQRARSLLAAQAAGPQIESSITANPEPWYGVRLVYRLTAASGHAYEERVIIVRATSFDDAIAQAEQYSKDYESESTEYVGYAMCFHIFDESGSSLGPGTEVFSLIRKSELSLDAYLDRFHDTGSECAQTSIEG